MLTLRLGGSRSSFLRKRRSILFWRSSVESLWDWNFVNFFITNLEILVLLFCCWLILCWRRILHRFRCHFTKIESLRRPSSFFTWIQQVTFLLNIRKRIIKFICNYYFIFRKHTIWFRLDSIKQKFLRLLSKRVFLDQNWVHRVSIHPIFLCRNWSDLKHRFPFKWVWGQVDLFHLHLRIWSHVVLRALRIYFFNCKQSAWWRMNWVLKIFKQRI